MAAIYQNCREAGFRYFLVAETNIIVFFFSLSIWQLCEKHLEYFSPSGKDHRLVFTNSQDGLPHCILTFSIKTYINITSWGSRLSTSITSLKAPTHCRAACRTHDNTVLSNKPVIVASWWLWCVFFAVSPRWGHPLPPPSRKRPCTLRNSRWRIEIEGDRWEVDGPSPGLDAKQLQQESQRDGGGNTEIPVCYVTAAFFCAFFLSFFFFGDLSLLPWLVSLPMSAVI